MHDAVRRAEQGRHQGDERRLVGQLVHGGDGEQAPVQERVDLARRPSCSRPARVAAALDDPLAGEDGEQRVAQRGERVGLEQAANEERAVRGESSGEAAGRAPAVQLPAGVANDRRQPGEPESVVGCGRLVPVAQAPSPPTGAACPLPLAAGRRNTNHTDFPLG